MSHKVDIFISPQRYIQRKNILEEAGSYAWGKALLNPPFP